MSVFEVYAFIKKSMLCEHKHRVR